VARSRGDCEHFPCLVTAAAQRGLRPRVRGGRASSFRRQHGSEAGVLTGTGSKCYLTRRRSPSPINPTTNPKTRWLDRGPQSALTLPVSRVCRRSARRQTPGGRLSRLIFSPTRPPRKDRHDQHRDSSCCIGSKIDRSERRVCDPTPPPERLRGRREGARTLCNLQGPRDGDLYEETKDERKRERASSV